MADGMPPATGSPIALENLPELPPESAPRVELAVRPRQRLWDRVKFLLLLAALWWVLVWAALANNPIESISDAINSASRSLWWVEALFVVEVLRQIHYFISERSPRWNSLFANHIFGGLNRLTHHLSDWTRFRIARVLKVLVVLMALAIVLAAFYHTSPVVSLFQIPAAIIAALPLIVQVIFFMFLAVSQFVAIFWFMSRGGVDTYFPGDVKTRFTDVWGQDSVLARVKENIIFLRDPESIEQRGGYVPGGILLWGPPGTGKTLIAEAVAGETQNPFVFVDPGAFQAMFMGIGILKVKTLFRKVRKLALRYGGVVVFFDEADSLGNRGALAGGGGLFPGRFSHPSGLDGSLCNGMSYLSGGSASQLFSTMLRKDIPDEEPPRRSITGMMMGGMMGGGAGMGTLQALLSEMSGLTKPARRVQHASSAGRSVLRPRAAAEVPNPHHDGDEHARLPRRGPPAPGAYRPHLQGRLPIQGGARPHLPGLFQQGRQQPHHRGPRPARHDHPLCDRSEHQGPRQRVTDQLDSRVPRRHHVVRRRAREAAEGPRPARGRRVRRARAACGGRSRGLPCAGRDAPPPADVVIDIATIEKGGSYLGMVSSVRAEDTFTQWRSDYEADVIVSLASLAGEKIFFEGDNSSGVSGDLNTATIIATYMEGYWGMGQTVASHGITQSIGIGGAPVRDRRRDERGMIEGRGLGERIEGKLIDLLQRTATLIEANRHEILALAHALERYKTITGDDVVAIVNGTKGPLIDGRQYHTPQFMDLAEAYHAEVVRAHNSHDTVNIPLPVLPEYVEPLEAVAANGFAASNGNGNGNEPEGLRGPRR